MAEKPTENKKTSDVSSWTYASEGTQLAVTLLLSIYAGYKLDQWKNTSPWFLLAGALLGISAGLYNFLKRFLGK
jgi:F0F1-type ATP synthase assembly protein I